MFYIPHDDMDSVKSVVTHTSMPLLAYWYKHTVVHVVKLDILNQVDSGDMAGTDAGICHTMWCLDVKIHCSTAVGRHR